eukprot:snap_masked-scaffold770_size100439-processed-gene-0.5 protein:Tk05385 transcript:snap_masked-scaffold770_size100439-processed-gene-0.5-mRNA-1 annotation:"slowmo homolog 2"
MKIWTSEHVFAHNWETVTQGQWRKYPNPHNTAVMGTDVVERRVDEAGVMHSRRLIASDWGLAPWVQRLIGANQVCYAHEYSRVDPARQLMEMESVNLTFCSFVSMQERMSYRPHPQDPAGQTLMKQETVVTVRGVPLTSYMEGIILNTVSANAGKGRAAIDWVVDKLKNETRCLSESIDKLKLEVTELTHTVEDKLIHTAKTSLDELQRDLLKLQPRMLKAEPIKDSSADS